MSDERQKLYHKSTKQLFHNTAGEEVVNDLSKAYTLHGNEKVRNTINCTRFLLDRASRVTIEEKIKFRYRKKKKPSKICKTVKK